MASPPVWNGADHVVLISPRLPQIKVLHTVNIYFVCLCVCFQLLSFAPKCNSFPLVVFPLHICMFVLAVYAYNFVTFISCAVLSNKAIDIYSNYNSHVSVMMSEHIHLADNIT